MESTTETIRKELQNKSYNAIVLSNKRWFNNTYIKQIETPIEKHSPSEMLIPGKIYTFLYDPKTKDRLSFYDCQPMTLILGHLPSKDGKGWNAFGINLSYIPPTTRAAVLDKIITTFNTMIIKPNMESIKRGLQVSQDVMPIEYKLAKRLLKDSGFEFALRSYIYKRMYLFPRIIDYENWWKLTTFTSDYIELLSIRSIYYRYKRQLDDDYRIGRKEKKLKLKKFTQAELRKYLFDKKDK